MQLIVTRASLQDFASQAGLITDALARVLEQWEDALYDFSRLLILVCMSFDVRTVLMPAFAIARMISPQIADFLSLCCASPPRYLLYFVPVVS